MNDDLIIGIDLGTTNSLVGVVDSGFPIVLADAEGARLIPSCVTWPIGQPILVGREALRSRILSPTRTVSSVKRLIGRSFSDLDPEEIREAGFAIRRGPGDTILIVIDQETIVTPEEVSTLILSRLKEIAEEALETTVSRAVITVPAYFNHSQREATKRAAESAGLRVERILNEPTAAALAYGLEKLDESATVAVYDFGGGTFDLSVLQMKDGFFEVIATAGDSRLGGDELDHLIAHHFREILSLGEVSPEEEATLYVRAREAKEVLSSETSTTVRFPFFRESASYEVVLSRETLEILSGPTVDRTRPLCQRAFAEAANKGASKIDRLILVGGTTRIPLVQEKLKTWFGLEPDLSQHPDETVALGAAIQAGMLCGRIQQIILVDVTPLSLGIETFGGLMNVIIPRNSTIPIKAGELFTNAVDFQDSMSIRVLQGEREMARDNWLLGEVTIPFEPGLKGSARVGVQFSIDRNGILEVLARDTATGEDFILEIRNAAINVDDDAVERMISESIDFAFEDMNERIWTEAQRKSEELLPAVDEALTQVGALLPESDLLEIRNACEAVRALLFSDPHDATALKRANATLDDATQTLAALLVEAAFSNPGE